MKKIKKLEEIGYKVRFNKKDQALRISKSNFRKQIAICLFGISVILLIGSFVYLALFDQVGFSTGYLRISISAALILFLVGLGVRSAHSSKVVTLSIDSRVHLESVSNGKKENIENTFSDIIYEEIESCTFFFAKSSNYNVELFKIKETKIFGLKKYRDEILDELREKYVC